MNNLFNNKKLFIIIFSLISIIIYFLFFYKIFFNIITINPLSFSHRDINLTNPLLWTYIKIYSIIITFFSNIIIYNFFYNKYFINSNSVIQNKTSEKNTLSKKEINLLIGLDQNNNKIYLNEYSLYQNILITGTIGSGKTSSAIYPFLDQLISYENNNINKKLGFLILDVKGNMFFQVQKYAKKYKRENDIIEISLDSGQKYNPLHKPDLNPIVLANRLKTILTLFSPETSESYWLDKVEQILSESIKLCRIYNKGYVTFEEIHKLISSYDYYKKILKKIRKIFLSRKIK